MEKLRYSQLTKLVEVLHGLAAVRRPAAHRTLRPPPKRPPPPSRETLEFFQRHDCVTDFELRHTELPRKF